MTISLAGQYVTLQTSFGLQVRWDGNHYAQITVPRSVKRLGQSGELSYTCEHSLDDVPASYICHHNKQGGLNLVNPDVTQSIINNTIIQSQSIIQQSSPRQQLKLKKSQS